MSKNLYDFANNSSKSGIQESKAPTEEEVKNKINQYSNLSKDEMMNELFNEVHKSKQNGTFNYNQIASSLDMVKDYLSEEQIKNLQNLLEKIR